MTALLLACSPTLLSFCLTFTLVNGLNTHTYTPMVQAALQGAQGHVGKITGEVSIEPTTLRLLDRHSNH